MTLAASAARRAALESDDRFRRGAPLSPLDGIPITIKDNLEVAGLRCTWGSRLFAQHVPESDELPVARLRAAGAVIVGKTNCSEFAMVGHTDNEVFGLTRNPWDLKLSAGGSSGGAVAAVAAGFAPLALATDGGGSTRRPAAHTGLVGFKPSSGRLARHGGLPAIFLDYEVIGVIARTTEDSIMLTRALAASDPSDPGSMAFAGRPLDIASEPPRLRILHVRQFGTAPVDPRIDALISIGADQLTALGHVVEHVDRWDVANAISECWMRVAQSGLARIVEKAAAIIPALKESLASNEFTPDTLLSPVAWAAVQSGRALAATGLFEVLAEVASLRQEMAQCFARYDVLLTPATAAWPWPAEQMFPATIDGQAVGPRGHAVFTAFANAAGLPAISLPCGRSAEGLPNGMQCVAGWGNDALLLALARQWERAHPWHERWPAVAAIR